MVFLFVILGIVVLLSVILLVRARGKARLVGPPDPAVEKGKHDLQVNKAVTGAIMTHNIGTGGF